MSKEVIPRYTFNGEYVYTKSEVSKLIVEMVERIMMQGYDNEIIKDFLIEKQLTNK